MDLNLRSLIIIFESILTTFEASVFFAAAGAVVNISRKQLSLTKLSLSKSLIRTVVNTLELEFYEY